jgi:long-chain acyl-CoA synthetase
MKISDCLSVTEIHFIFLSAGEYIAPEKIENVYTRSPLLQQCFVYGDSLKPQLVAVAVPDPEVLIPWAKERGLPADMPSLCRDASVNAAIIKSMHEEGRVAKLKGFEQVSLL